MNANINNQQSKSIIHEQQVDRVMSDDVNTQERSHGIPARIARTKFSHTVDCTVLYCTHCAVLAYLVERDRTV